MPHSGKSQHQNSHDHYQHRPVNWLSARFSSSSPNARRCCHAATTLPVSSLPWRDRWSRVWGRGQPVAGMLPCSPLLSKFLQGEEGAGGRRGERSEEGKADSGDSREASMAFAGLQSLPNSCQSSAFGSTPPQSQACPPNKTCSVGAAPALFRPSHAPSATTEKS